MAFMKRSVAIETRPGIKVSPQIEDSLPPTRVSMGALVPKPEPCSLCGWLPGDPEIPHQCTE